MRFLPLTVVVLTACPAQRQSAVDEDDPLLRKLQAEKVRLARPLKMPEADALAQAAVQPDPPTSMNVPHGSMHFGDALFTLKSLERSHTIKGDSVALSTVDSFLKVTLTGEASVSHPFDLTGTTLVFAGNTYTVDRAAQRVGHGTPLTPTLGISPQDLVLFFEVPATSLAPGLKLIMQSADTTAELALQ